MKRKINEPFVMYQIRRKNAQSKLKKYLRGTLVWCSAQMVSGKELNLEALRMSKKAMFNNNQQYKVAVQGTYRRQCTAII